MGILAGPYVAAAALLVLSGVLKVRRPAPTSKALRSAGLAPLAPLARALGVAEIVVGVGALAVDTRVFPALVAAAYLVFAAFVALTLARKAPVADCGCFGATDSPPSAVHLTLDVAAALVAGAVAVGSGGDLARATDGQPLLALPFLALGAVCVGLAYGAMTVLPRALDVAAGRER
jgi:hypothetical protein